MVCIPWNLYHCFLCNTSDNELWKGSSPWWSGTPKMSTPFLETNVSAELWCIQHTELVVLSSWGAFAVFRFKSPAVSSSTLHWAAPCAEWPRGWLASFAPEVGMYADLLQAAQFPTRVPSFIASALRKADRGLLTAVRNFAFLPNSFDSFSGSVHYVVLILSKR